MRSRTTDAEFTAFASDSAAYLSRTAWLLTGDGHRADELVQATLVRTYVAWSRVRREDALSYARRVLVNLHTDTWRRRRREDLVEDVASDATGSSPGGAADRDAVHRNVLDRQALLPALRTLTDRERAVIVLRYFADLTEQQTADELDVAVGTVKSTASRALRRLRTAPTLARQQLTPTPSDRSTR